MPTTDRRLMVNLPSEAFDGVRAIAAATDQSMSNVVRDLVLAALPAFRRVTEICELANAAKREHKAGIGAVFRTLEEALPPLLVQAEGSLEQAFQALSPGEGAGSGRASTPRSARSGPAPKPPSCNTGVILSQGGSKRGRRA